MHRASKQLMSAHLECDFPIVPPHQPAASAGLDQVKHRCLARLKLAPNTRHIHATTGHSAAAGIQRRDRLPLMHKYTHNNTHQGIEEKHSPA